MLPLEVIELPWLSAFKVAWLLFGLIALGGAVITVRLLRKPEERADQ